MKLRFLIGLFLLGTIFSWASWLVTLFFIDPTMVGGLGLSLFYISLTLALVGSFFLVGNSFRKTFFRNMSAPRRASTSFRQSVFFSILLVTSAILQSFNLTTWWNIGLLIVLLVMIEFFFMSRQRQVSTPQDEFSNPRA